MSKRIFAVLLVLTSSIQPVGAVRHVVPGAYPNAKQDEIGRPSAARIHAARSMRAAILGGASGIKAVAVILVQFPASSCAGCTSGTNTLTAGDLLAIDGYFTDLAAYYTEVSNGAITLNFSFFGTNSVLATGS